MTKIIVEYVWIDASGENLRSKCKTLDFIPKNVTELPKWDFDGSSTGQASGDNSEVFLIPVRLYNDPFRKGKHLLVLCKCELPDGTPAKGNNRVYAEKRFKGRMYEKPWYGIEQEYIMFHKDGITPLGWPRNGYPAPVSYTHLTLPTKA